MSSIAPAIVSQLLANSGVAGLIGARLYPEYDRQKNKVYPLCCYKIEAVTANVANDGPTGLMSADVVIAAVGETYAAAAAVAAALQAALDGARGTWSGVVVQGCFLKDDGISDNVVTEPTTEEILYYIQECSFTIWYS